MKYLFIDEDGEFSTKNTISEADLQNNAEGTLSIVTFADGKFSWAEALDTDDSEDGENPNWIPDWHEV